MGVKMDEGDRAVDLGEPPQFRQGDGVVSAQQHRHAALLAEAGGFPLDDGKGFLDIAGDDVHISGVHAVQHLEDVHIQHVMIGLEDGRGFADGRRPEAAAGPVGGARIEGNAHDGEIVPLDVLTVGETLEGTDTAKTGRLERVDRLAHILFLLGEKVFVLF